VKKGGQLRRYRRKRGNGSNLLALSRDPLEYGPESALCKTRLLASFFVVRISCTQPFGAEIESVAKWLMNASQNILAGHENLKQESAIEQLSMLAN
jgi:hypothetical protein